MTTSILWLRRDLRLHDEPALDAALRVAASAGDGGRLLPIYVLDLALLRGRWASPNRNAFLLGSLDVLAADLAARGSGLHVEVGDPVEVVPRLAAAVGATEVAVTRDHGPYGRHRDRRVAEALEVNGRRLRATQGGLVHEPDALATAAGEPFRVYSPFKRAWDAAPRRAPLPAPDRLPPLPDALSGGGAEAANAEAARRILDLDGPTADPAALPEPGEAAARRRLDRWLEDGIAGYATARDDLRATDRTSRLSQDLRFGLLSPLEVVERAAEAAEATAAAAATGRARPESTRRWVAEIAWREFYAHVLWHRPDVLRRPFRPAFEDLAWRDDDEAFEAWAAGRTGYPIVDAAMRQLAATGFMANRARMIAASFLTKDLLIDWRRGEAHFMRHLIDGDPAQNNGGWQWTASTGTDPQPYFRIFNPVLQGERHDPRGEYVRHWLPELVAVPDRWVHRPWEAPPGTRPPSDAYPLPIVDHAAARERALAAYAAARDRA